MPPVKIVEIGPRDGFQSVKEFIPTELKKEAIDRLVAAGIGKIQVTSFVSPKAIPQMRDAREVAEYVTAAYPELEAFALVPNLTGAKLAAAAGIKEIGPVMSLSESHNQANINRTVAQSIEETAKIRQEFPDLKITQDIAVVFGCPFEGRMPVEPLVELIGKIRDLGVRAFTLCDTVGVAYPKQIKAVFEKVRSAFPETEFNAHIHDTRNMGIINSYTAILNGADSVQTAIGGLGGCPFAPGASGNTATEDLAYMLRLEGYDTGLDMEKLVETVVFLRDRIEGNYSGHHAVISAPFPESP
ncbi:MAG: hydroxymethylglutaryl-CoA lyase [Planctomycetes bacterium]|nr:hydroxymethylglutaryl-CoA lyase [Planctomycetota bacterium]